MMILTKIILLQLFWFFVVLYGRFYSSYIPIFASMFLVFLDYKLTKPKLALGNYLFIIATFVVCGFINDFSLVWLKLIANESYKYGNLSLWIIFIIYYEELFVKFSKLHTAITAFIGGVGGALAYWSAAKLGALEVMAGRENDYLIFNFIFWAIFFPFSLRLYFDTSYWDHFLDKTIFFSFDQSGFFRHQKYFTENFKNLDLSGKVALVTGGTSGIGAEVVAGLSSGTGPKIIVTGRNEVKGNEFSKKFHDTSFVSLDMADWETVLSFAKNVEVLDYIVFNAGGMPDKISKNKEGVESQYASQLLGHYYLLMWLKDFGKIKSGARIVWVSSGGMYLKKLDLDSLFNNQNYDKVDTYANVKRAQVTLVEELAKDQEFLEFDICCMHPGWVATDGLKFALPRFYSFMKHRLRQASEGADTIIWCLLTKTKIKSGSFYFDRKEVSAYMSKKYIPTDVQRAQLLQIAKKNFLSYKT